MTADEFQAAIRKGIPGKRCDEPGLNKDAIFVNHTGAWRIYLPWRGKVAGTLFKPILETHQTHHNVIGGIYPIHNSILDVGGYDGNWVWLFDAQRKVVLDTCCEALDRWAIIHADETWCADAADIGELFRKDEFDVVLLLDVLEHLEPDAGMACLKAAEEIARYQVIVAVPDGWLPFDETNDAWAAMSEVPCLDEMRHRSGWHRQFFEGRGYHVVVQKDQHVSIGGGDALVCFYDKQ